MSALCPGLRLHDNEYVSQVLKSLNRIYNILDTEGNGSQLINPDISSVNHIEFEYTNTEIFMFRGRQICQGY